MNRTFCIGLVTVTLAMITSGEWTLAQIRPSYYPTGTRLAVFNPEPESNGGFGGSIAGSDGNLLISARNNDHGDVQGAGVAFLVSATDGTVLHTFAHPDPMRSDGLGSSVATYKQSSLVATFGSSIGQRPGHVLVFDNDTGVLIHTLPHPTDSKFDAFGIQMAVIGDLLAVAAIGDDKLGIDSGAVHIYNIPNATFVRTIYRRARAGWITGARQRSGRRSVTGPTSFQRRLRVGQLEDRWMWAAAGDLDPTFDGDGIVTTAISSGHDIAIQADGKIVVSGFSSNGRNSDFALALNNANGNANGSLDTSFSGDGKVTTDFGTSDLANAVAERRPRDHNRIGIFGNEENESPWASFSHLLMFDNRQAVMRCVIFLHSLGGST